MIYGIKKEMALALLDVTMTLIVVLWLHMMGGAGGKQN
jgi:hypothetical protein